MEAISRCHLGLDASDCVSPSPSCVRKGAFFGVILNPALDVQGGRRPSVHNLRSRAAIDGDKGAVGKWGFNWSHPAFKPWAKSAEAITSGGGTEFVSNSKGTADAGKGIVESFRDFMQSIFSPGKSESSPEAAAKDVPAPSYRLSVLVAGATGGVGRHIVRYLLQDDCRVIALARDPAAAEKMFVEEMGLSVGPNSIGGTLEIRQGDVRDVATLAPALDGCEAVVCAVGCRFQSPPGAGGDATFEERSSPELVDFRGVAALARAAFATLPSAPRERRDTLLFDFAACGTTPSSSPLSPPGSLSNPSSSYQSTSPSSASPPTKEEPMFVRTGGDATVADRSNDNEGFTPASQGGNFCLGPAQGDPAARSASSSSSSSSSSLGDGSQASWAERAGACVDGWEPRDDAVMGGRSESVLRPDDGCAVFEGMVRVDGGGFCSVRSLESQAGLLASTLPGHDGILLRVRGDGQRYKVTLITPPAPEAKVDANEPSPPHPLVETAHLLEPPQEIMHELAQELTLPELDPSQEAGAQPVSPKAAQEEGGLPAGQQIVPGTGAALEVAPEVASKTARVSAEETKASSDSRRPRDLRYQASFDTVAGRWVDVRIPFDRFRAVIRSKLQPGTPPLNLAAVKQMALTLSLVEYNSEENPLFLGGAFKLQVQRMSAYSLPRPQFVLLSSAGVERSAGCGSDEERRTHIPIVQLNPGNILRWKLAGEDAVRASGLPYAVVRACGLSREDEATPFRLQVAQGDSISGTLSRSEAAVVCARCLGSTAATDTTFEVRRDELSRGFIQDNYLQLFRQLRRDNVPNLPILPNTAPPCPELPLLNIEVAEPAPLTPAEPAPVDPEPVTFEPK